jgi:hypothetical protein
MGTFGSRAPGVRREVEVLLNQSSDQRVRPRNREPTGDAGESRTGHERAIGKTFSGEILGWVSVSEMRSIFGGILESGGKFNAGVYVNKGLIPLSES